jgi:uncharacterized protein YcfL
MKKIVSFTASALIASLLLAGCSSKEGTQKEDLSKMQTETMQQMKDMSEVQKSQAEKIKADRAALEAERAALEAERAAFEKEKADMEKSKMGESMPETKTENK